MHPVFGLRSGADPIVALRHQLAPVADYRVGHPHAAQKAGAEQDGQRFRGLLVVHDRHLGNEFYVWRCTTVTE